MNQKYKTRLDNPVPINLRNPDGSNLPLYEPTEKEIEAGCSYIQSLWSEDERRVRALGIFIDSRGKRQNFNVTEHLALTELGITEVNTECQFDQDIGTHIPTHQNYV